MFCEGRAALSEPQRRFCRRRTRVVVRGKVPACGRVEEVSATVVYIQRAQQTHQLGKLGEQEALDAVEPDADEEDVSEAAG